MPSSRGGNIDLAMNFGRLVPAVKGLPLGVGAGLVADLVFALIGAAGYAEVAAALVAVVATPCFIWAYS